MVTLHPFNPTDSALQPTLVDLWNVGCGGDLAISARLLAFNTAPAPEIAQSGCLALAGGQPVGFVLASAVSGLGIAHGWVDAIAVAPILRRHGVGSALLAWAEAWLRKRGCTAARLGGSLRPFTAGLPAELGTAPFFARRGYASRGASWDVARSLQDWTADDTRWAAADGAQVMDNRRAAHGAQQAAAVIAAVQPGQEEVLHSFLSQAFPGRWAWECADFLRSGGRASDYLLLQVDGQAAGFCQVTCEDSLRPIERFFPARLPRPWGQLGPIGVSAAYRGRGYGSVLLAAGLSYLRSHGADGCIIDWTDLLEFYSRFGFLPYRRYEMLVKELS